MSAFECIQVPVHLLVTRKYWRRRLAYTEKRVAARFSPRYECSEEHLHVGVDSKGRAVQMHVYRHRVDVLPLGAVFSEGFRTEYRVPQKRHDQPAPGKGWYVIRVSSTASGKETRIPFQKEYYFQNMEERELYLGRRIARVLLKQITEVFDGK